MDFNEAKFESNKPNPSPFYQQKLKGWQPIINTNNLYLCFFAIGIIFIFIGSCLVYLSYQVTEVNIDYTNCLNNDGEKCSNILTTSNYTWSYKSCVCAINITIPQDMKGPAFVYYGLTNFFQNHRRYVVSRDDKQLKGLHVDELSSDCNPFGYANMSSKIAYAPCGIIANSLFNDTFRLEHISRNGVHTVPWTKDGIAWKADSEIRFGEQVDWNDTVKPVNWPIDAHERNNKSYKGDSELLVWLRSAALPNFKKLHRIIVNTQEPFTSGLPRGNYVLHINYSYPVSSFGGTKTFIISATNFMGGKNPAMGITYLSIGTLYFSLGVVFLFINAFVARRRQNEAWFIATQAGNNGVSNETFCHVEAGDNSVFVDHCPADADNSLA